MEAYSDFATVYDTFMDETPYDVWGDYVAGLIDGDEYLFVVEGCAVSARLLVGAAALHLQLLGSLVGGNGGNDA